MTDHLTDTNVGNIEYIRREDMLNAVEKLDIIPSVDGMGIPTDTEDFRVQFLGTVLKVEPADVVQVVHGRWIDTDSHLGYFANCSACGYQMDVHTERGYFKYCPNCGTKMDEVE